MIDRPTSSPPPKTEERGRVMRALRLAVSAIPLLRRLVGPADGRSRPDPMEAPQLPGRGASELASFWRRLVDLNARIEACWVGDLIGVAGLFVLLIAGLFFAGVYQ